MGMSKEEWHRQQARKEKGEKNHGMFSKRRHRIKLP
jgi:hypothetical protein